MVTLTLDSYAHELLVALAREHLALAEAKLRAVRDRWGDQPGSRAGQMRREMAMGARNRAARTLEMLKV